MTVTEPIIIAEGGDVSVFRTAAEAGRALEARDVREGVYVAFDAAGWPLDLSYDPSPAIDRAAVRIRPHADRAAPGALRALLAGALIAAGEAPDANAPLSALVERAIVRLGFRR